MQLVHHRIDGVFELQDFTADVDGDLPRQVAPRNRSGYGYSYSSYYDYAYRGKYTPKPQSANGEAVKR